MRVLDHRYRDRMSNEKCKYKEEEQTRCVCHESAISVRLFVGTSQLLRAALYTIGYGDRIEVPFWA